MLVSGEDAARFNAMRLDNYACVNVCILLEANEETGLVRWLDSTGTEKSVTLGSHTIRIAIKSGYGR
jgi:hypothetical protein